jgi:hypothetical protein
LQRYVLITGFIVLCTTFKVLQKVKQLLVAAAAAAATTHHQQRQHVRPAFGREHRHPEHVCVHQSGRNRARASTLTAGHLAIRQLSLKWSAASNWVARLINMATVSISPSCKLQTPME